jgi:hypothetical protein
MRKPLVGAASFISARTKPLRPGLSIRAGNPYLVRDYRHHEQKVESKRPEDEEFGTLKPPPGEWGCLLGPHATIMFERR